MRRRLAAFGLIGVTAFAARAHADDASATQPATFISATLPATDPAANSATGPAMAAGSTGPRPMSQYRYANTVFVDAPYASPASSFAPREFAFTLGGEGLSVHGNHGDDSIGFVTFAFDYFFVDNLSVGLELGVAPGTASRHHHHDDDHHDDDNGVRAVDELAVLRWRFFKTGPLSLYIEGGAGSLQAWPAYPSGGRRDNFIGVAGGGLSWRFVDHFYANIGARAAFLNGNDDRYDSGGFRHHRDWSDGFEYYGGVTYLFP